MVSKGGFQRKDVTLPDIITVGGLPFGVGFSILLYLAPPDWREKHKTFVSIGWFTSFTLMAFGLLIIATYFLPIEVNGVMIPRVMMIAGIAFLGCGAAWQFSLPAGAQSAPAVAPSQPTPSPPSPPIESGAASAPPLANTNGAVLGGSVTGNSQGGPAAVINNTGLPGQPSTGAEINATGCGGQNVTGLRVTQNGPGTGLQVMQNGPGVGLRVITTIGGPNCPR